MNNIQEIVNLSLESLSRTKKTFKSIEHYCPPLNFTDFQKKK